jgi:hypothetical protein
MDRTHFIARNLFLIVITFYKLSIKFSESRSAVLELLQVLTEAR